MKDPVHAGPELQRRLRKQVRYSNGLLLIEDPLLHQINTVPATAAWSVSCDDGVGVQVYFGGGENSTEVDVVPLGTRISKGACAAISEEVGTAVLRLTSGQ